MAKLLAEYCAKRDFTKTPEPKGGKSRARGSRFFIQKHAAKRLHYDLRLELDGVLKSWAVTKGPSLVAGEKRLAVHVEDHPLDYGEFEGTIPDGEYGGGTVLLWDRGTWEPEGDPREGYAKGRLTFRLKGEKLHGSWHLVRMRRKPRERQEQWLLIKSEDKFARPSEAPDLLEEAPQSVKTGRSMDEIATGRAKARSKSPARPETGAVTASKSAAKSRQVRADAKGSDPLPASIQPCLATLVDQVPTGPKWLHEIKWDGYRLIAFLERGKVRLKTRNDKDWTKRFPTIAKAIAELPVTSAVLDGEAVVEDESGIANFAALQNALSNEGDGVAHSAIFQAFDLLYLDGKDLRGAPLEERKERLAKLIPSDRRTGALRFSEHLESDGEAMVRSACRLGLEGVISKRRDFPYRSGRNEDWLKIKCTERQEFVIAGFTPSSAVKGAVGSLVLGYYEGPNLIYAGRTGTGFTTDLARNLYKKLDKLRTAEPPFSEKLASAQRRGVSWVRPELIGEVEFRGWTSDKVVRHAAFKGLRDDKDAREVVQETRRAPAGRSRPKAARMSSSGPSAVAGVSLTHPDRILWEDQGITKQGLAEFYVEIADWLLPHIANRPLSLVRCPSGAEKGCFFQKHAWAGLQDTVKREMVRDEKGEEEVLFVRDIKGVIALVQAGVLEIHPWGSTIKDVERPDRIIFDFDPGEGVDWPTVVDGAFELRERLRALKLESFAKTTGGKGLHVVVPLKSSAGWDEVKAFTRSVAEAMAADSPALYTTTSVKRERKGRIFVDYLRNSRGQTAVAAYSTRARPGAPISTPLSWEELSPAIRSNHFTVSNLKQRLDALRQDSWEGFAAMRQTLPKSPTPRAMGRRSR